MSKNISFENIDFNNDVFDKISVKLIKDIKLIPFDEDSKYLYVLNIENNKSYDCQVLKLIYQKRIKFFSISNDLFDKIVNHLSKSSIQGFYENILNKTTLENPIVNTLFEEKSEFYNHDIKNNYVVRTIDNIIDKAILLQASDIHFEPCQEFVNVRMRIDGELQKGTEISHSLYLQILSRIKVLSNLDITKHQLAQDGKIVYKYNNETYDIRVAILPTLYGERCTLRILDDYLNDFSLDDIYLDQQAKEELLRILDDQKGMVLVVGATGSGKTTTIYSLLKLMNNTKRNIITVEDPIEYSIDGISQVQVDEEIGLTFSQTLKSVLRQDPDVFMIGEIRDKESAEIAVRSASTGHMVFSTLHANDSVTAISRLYDMNVPSFLIGSSLKAIVYQKLFKRRCPKCIENKSNGCSYCNYTSFKGRIAIGEILIIDDKVSKDIINQSYHQTIDDYINTNKFVCISKLVEEAKIKKII